MTETVSKQTHGFQAEVDQVLKLMINSLYSNKEIFLRELISNAQDAADKLRFAAIEQPDLYGSDSELAIDVEFDKDANTVTIRDNGIGMNQDEVIANLGTIAKSGTREFLASLSGDQRKDSQMIGQFGVGFYSSFIVADQVTVRTLKAGSTATEAIEWQSAGEGEFSIETITKSSRGTEIILHLREGETEFLDHWRLRSIITKYSDHIATPIRMVKQLSEEEKEKGEAETYDVINQAKALWTQKKSDISDEQYQEFYKHISHDFENPLTWKHNRVEGKLEYTSLLYIPARAPFDMWNRDGIRGLKLFVQRVFIMDDVEQLVPLYLRFIKGVIDSNDLPLNVSREILQSSKTVDSIRAAVSSRVLGMLEEMADKDPETYQKFWNQFGNVLKEGPAEDYTNKDKIVQLLRFASTTSDIQNVSLQDYVARMPAEQEKIYYLTADTIAAAKSSPHLEIFQAKGIEVLLMTDRVDEWLVDHVREFDGKILQSVAKGELDILDDEEAADKTDAEQEDEKQAFDKIIERIKTALGEKVKEVRTTKRLTASPACLVMDENDMGAHLQRMMQAAGQDVSMFKPILEINAKHPLVTKLSNETDDDKFKQWSTILFEQALLAEGGQLEDPGSFVRQLNEILVEMSRA